MYSLVNEWILLEHSGFIIAEKIRGWKIYCLLLEHSGAVTGADTGVYFFQLMMQLHAIHVLFLHRLPFY